MSGSMALAAARRRRVNVIEQPPLQRNRQNQNPVNTNVNVNVNNNKENEKIMVTPLTIMKQHHNEILNIKEEIKKINDTKDNFDYKENYDTLLKEFMEMKKTIVKLQSFIMDIDIEIKKLKETKNTVLIEEDDLSNTD
jgi:predicted  nucleic acid-binding Zn-ribbon protein